MSSWHDDITGYHNEEIDDLHVGKNDLKDLAMDRSDCSRNRGDFTVAVH